MLKKLIYIAIGLYIFYQVSPIFTFLGVYILILIFSGKDPGMKEEVQKHQIEMISMFKQYVEGILLHVPVQYVVFFLMGVVLILCVSFGVRMIIRETRKNKIASGHFLTKTELEKDMTK